MGNDALRERIGLKYVEWRTTLENQMTQIMNDKSHAKGASFLLISVVDGLVIQSLLKGEKIPYAQVAKFLIDCSNKKIVTSL